MARFCSSCGAALRETARFCGECGIPVSDEHVEGDPETVIGAEAAIVAAKKGSNWLLIGGSAAILLLLLLYYWIFIRDDVVTVATPAPTEKIAAKEVVETFYFAVADANIRDKPTTLGTTITGKQIRGTSAPGVIITGVDGTTPWLELAEGKGFIAMSNLSETEPPKIAKPLGDKIWVSDRAMDILAQPNASAPVLDRIAAATPITLFGLTGNDFIEIKLKKGGVGYIAQGARIAALASAKGKPIAISFNPASCNFSGELGSEFAKLTAKSRAAYLAIDKTDFPTTEARDTALVGFEGKSYFQRLERSFNGLSITGVAQHYESQSLYFADSPDKVLAVFRAVGFKIGRDGQFANTEIYAGIGATGGQGRSYGKTDLSCGV